MAQLNSASWSRVRSVIPRSLVAQYPVPPSGVAIPNTLTNPYPVSHTSVPVAAMAVSASARVPSRSLFTSRFALSRVTHVHPHPRINFKLSRLLYHPSNSTHRGLNPRAYAARIMSPKWSFLVRPSAFSYTR